MFDRILRYLSGDETIYECRSCGTTLDASEESCPACDSEDIARYDWR